MAITINWATKVISIPQADLNFISGTLYELDVNAFRLILRDLEDDSEGIPFDQTHSHNTEVTIGVIVFARFIEIINGYTITFEDGQYAVNLTGANNNISDVTNVNQVSIRSNNSAGLTNNTAVNQIVTGTLTMAEVLTIILSATAGQVQINGAGTVITLTGEDGSTVVRTIDVTPDGLSRTPQ